MAAAGMRHQAGLDLLSSASERAPSRLRHAPDPVPAPVAQALWSCAHLPRLALEVHARVAATARPLAVVDGEDRLRRVLACDDRAVALGVRPGLGLNTALALAPALCAIVRDARRERAALARLAAWAGRFTPRVSLDPPDALLLEVRGSLALFGGAEAFQQRLRDGLARLGYGARLGLAPTPLAATWLARAAEEQAVTAAHALAGRLAPVPLVCLRWPEAVQESLHGMGMRVLGDCLRLPRDGFARRFGVARLVELDRALGRRPDPRPDYVPPARFATQLELPLAAQTLEPVRHALALALEELCGYLSARAGGVQELHLGLVHHAGAVTQVRLELARPSRDPGHLLELYATRLERVDLPAPVLALRLRSGAVLATGAQTAELLAGRTQPAASGAQLVDRLRARLGVTAVHGLSPWPEHRPEAAWRVAEPGSAAAPGEDRERPLWLLAEPRPLALLRGAPCLEGPLDLLCGPERIETGWWDGAGVTRDYYVARTASGVRLWIYRERGGARAWFLQGVFG
jgi:protein ImuB